MTMLPLLKGQSAGLTEKILMDTLPMFKCHRHHKKRKLLENQQVSNKKTKIEELENENCYVIVFIVSYREITNKMFSLTQSKLYISKFLGPIKVIKKDLNNGWLSTAKCG